MQISSDHGRSSANLGDQAQTFIVPWTEGFNGDRQAVETLLNIIVMIIITYKFFNYYYNYPRKRVRRKSRLLHTNHFGRLNDVLTQFKSTSESYKWIKNEERRT